LDTKKGARKVVVRGGLAFNHRKRARSFSPWGGKRRRGWNKPSNQPATQSSSRIRKDHLTKEEKDRAASRDKKWGQQLEKGEGRFASKHNRFIG